MPANLKLGVMFDFPRLLTVSAYDRYEREAMIGIERANEIGDASKYVTYKIVWMAAANAGLLCNWKSYFMPSLEVQSEDELHAFTIEWTALQVRAWIKSQRAVPKKKLWRQPIVWIGMALRRMNLDWHGVLSVCRIYQAFTILMTKG